MMLRRFLLALVLGTLVLPFASGAALSLTPVPLSIRDSDGNFVDASSIRSGSQLVLSRSFHNSESSEREFLMLFEIRDSTGVSIQIAWQEGLVAAAGDKEVGVSWIAPDIGEYQIRIFVISNLTNPEVLSEVTATNIIVLEGKRPLDVSPQIIIDGNNNFAIDFYSKVVQSDEYRDKNVFYSPLSISTAFALVLEGARDQTAEEIRSVFQLPQDDEYRRALFAVLQDDLNNNQGNYTLSTANALWIKEGYDLSEDYVRIARESYKSEVSSVDIPSEESRVQINEWVESKTNDKITDLIPKGVLNDLTRLVITNAIYFKGIWVTQFDEVDTQEADFHVGSGPTVRAPMMNLREMSFRYAENDLVQIIELPYQGKKVSMLIILPKAQDGLPIIEDSLSIDNLQSWKDELKNVTVNVSIPKFKLETDYSLGMILSEMGMPAAFNSTSADLSGITTEERLHIQAALHKAFVEVNEEGTEAAAATGVVIGTESVQVYPTFKADHPFIFIIQDSETGNILFLGRVANPAA